MGVELKRVYEPPMPADGRRILVDRLWPRGLSRAAAGIDGWMKALAPSTALRQWFGHEPDKWPEFKQRYRAELEGSPVLVELRALAGQENITLVYAARDCQHNSVVVLKEVLDDLRLK